MLKVDLPTKSLSGSNFLDFLLIGGLALVVWLIIMVGEGRWYWVDPATAAFPTGALFLANFVNHPHFMISYKLAYSRGASFLLKNTFQLAIVPMVLLGLAFAGFYWGNDTPTSGGIVSILNPLYTLLGAAMRPERYATFSQATLALLISGMYFTVGWHYAKQAFGAMMVYGHFDGYALLPWQRVLIRYSLLSTWWTTWLYGQMGSVPYSYYSLGLFRLDLPRPLYWISLVVTWSLAAFFWIGVIVRNLRLNRTLPSLNFIVPWVALFIWHLPPFHHPEYFYIIALFHSLQYMPFVFKIEKARLVENPRSVGWPLRLVLIAIFTVVTGYLSFHYLPESLDPQLNTKTRFGMEYVLIATLAFINIHHYFIDNVLWRFKDPRVKEWLLA